jgi:DNA-binding transcriptional MerR regulator
MDDDPMAMQMPKRREMQGPEQEVLLPDKLYFRIGEVARLSGLPAHVLRFWETEFPQLRPHKGGTGQRLYRKRDVEMVLEIKRLLYEQKFTIPGARRVLAEKRHAGVAQKGLPLQVSLQGQQPGPQQGPIHTRIQQVRGELREILGILDGNPPHQRSMLAPSKRRTRTARMATAETNTPMLF